MGEVTPELEAAQRAWQDAIESRDVTAAEGLLHDEYSLVLVHRRPALLARRQQIYQRATVLGEDRTGMFIITDLWRRVEGTWRVWKRHSTPLAPVF